MEQHGFESFRGRPAPSPGDRVRAYRNLNRPSKFSLVAMSGPEKGRVLGYARCVELEAIALKVSDKLRDRLLREQTRNVHAYAEGRFIGAFDSLPGALDQEACELITYQPFIRNFFSARANPEEPVWSLNRAWLFGANVVSLA